MGQYKSVIFKNMAENGMVKEQNGVEITVEKDNEKRAKVNVPLFIRFIYLRVFLAIS